MYVENVLHRCDKFADNERPTLMQIYDALYQNVFDFMQLTTKLELLATFRDSPT